MKKTSAQRFTMGTILLMIVLVLNGCAATASKPAPSAVSSASRVSPAGNVSVTNSTVSSSESKVSTPAVYRIGTATLANAKTSTDDSLIGTSGIKHSYRYKEAIADGALVSISDVNTGSGYVIYNTARFDAFIKNPMSKGIWVFHYILSNNVLSIHEMELIQYTGSGFTATSYDPYCNSKSVTNFDHIVKEDWPNAIRYGAADKGASDDNSARIMSFFKVCVYS